MAYLTLLTVPAGAAAPFAEVDIDAFSSRADAWSAARDAYREEAHEQALDLAEEARQAEVDRIAAEEAVLEAERQAELARQRAAEEAARTTTTTAPPTTQAPDPGGDGTTTTTEPPPPPAGTPTAAQWEVLRQCESSGNYSIVSSNGLYRGVYQFSQATWDWVASVDFPSLAGIDPATAAPADQDAMALALWIRQGWNPWPICGQQAAAA
ncbi:MAG: transglycosylase family protein [Acidimicrobiales bacterium]|nr:transglycosylase family protein [Acidimicrobiales bacterium]